MEAKRILIYAITVVLITYTTYLLSGYFTDNSHTAFQAQKSGAPSISQAWEIKDYEIFSSYLSSLPESIDFPMLSSEKSGPIFNTFVNSLDKNLYEPASNESIFVRIIKLKRICQNILKLYIEKDLDVHKYTDEIAYLYGIQLQILSKMLEVANRIEEPANEKSSNAKLRLRGLNMMNQGAIVQVSVVLDLISETDTFKNNEILLRYFKQYVPELLHSLEKKRSIILQERIMEVSNKVETQSLKKLLQTVVTTL